MSFYFESDITDNVIIGSVSWLHSTNLDLAASLKDWEDFARFAFI